LLKWIQTLVYDFAGTDLGGEFVFIPHPNARTEDDGWLIGFRYIEAKDASEVKNHLKIPKLTVMSRS
jgi:carotenoid cleavage dioxygenase-like enzyme